MTIKIYPYKPGSASARALARALGVKRLKHQGSRWRARQGDTVINWGSSSLPVESVYPAVVLNQPRAVAIAGNKLEAFRYMAQRGVPVPDFTCNRATAVGWQQEGDSLVVARTKLYGSGGDGLVMVQLDEDVPDAPLYTRYIPKKEEFRVHVVNGEVIFLQQKMRKLDHPAEEVNWQVRNLAGGFIFAHKDIARREDVVSAAIQAVDALGLDFGAADVIYNGNREQAYVLEVNTAPGLEGTTLERYVRTFSEL